MAAFAADDSRLHVFDDFILRLLHATNDLYFTIAMPARRCHIAAATPRDRTIRRFDDHRRPAIRRFRLTCYIQLRAAYDATPR